MNLHHHSTTTIVAISLVLFSFFLLLILSLLLFFYCKKQCQLSAAATSTTDDTSVTALLRARPVPMSELETATNGFHHAYLIGKGRIGTVYKATTSPGQAVAIKRLHPRLVLNHPGPTFSFIIKSVSFAAGHPNIVPVLGYAEAPGERIVIYEYVPMKTLETFLFGMSSDGWQLTRQLSWYMRVKIITGIARGLEHLHACTALGLLHGCLKPCNVFIDIDYCARISDYGLGFLFQGQEEKKGMVGYVDKEGSEVCKENDVYAFGVILLEMLSGRKSEGGKLVEWAIPLIRVSRVEELLDKRLGFPFMEIRVLERIAKVASDCVGNSRAYRLTMTEVVAVLNKLEMEQFS
ncbi:hypothetical protein LUZ60_013633 [Juncus effusus]|nr:hypothetical protein LUZ60_013633 [Juncus effusus]